MGEGERIALVLEADVTTDISAVYQCRVVVDLTEQGGLDELDKGCTEPVIGGIDGPH